MCFSPQRRAMFRNPTFKMWFDIRTSKSAPKTTVFQHFHSQMCFSPQRRTIVGHQNVQKCSEDYSFLTFSLPNVPFATAACIFSTAARPKVVQTRHVLKILTSKCAFRHSRVHFFNISTYKSAPNTSCFVHFHLHMCVSPQHSSCFVHFHLHMCVSPQRRAIFRHLNLQKCSKHLMFCTFSFPHMLFATAACVFSTAEEQKVLRS